MTEAVLYGILRHPVYIGKIHHRGELYEGQHEPILDIEIWQQASVMLDAQAKSKEGRYNPTGQLLQGKLCDVESNKYRTHFSEKPDGKRHHYYVSPDRNRIPAKLIEKSIIQTLQHPQTIKNLSLNEEQQIQWQTLLAYQPAQIIQPYIDKIIIGREATWISLNIETIEAVLHAASTLPSSSSSVDAGSESVAQVEVAKKTPYHLEIQLRISFAEKNAIYAHQANRHNDGLRIALGHGYRWQQILLDNPKLDQRTLAEQEKVDYRYLTRVLQMMLLAPDIMTAILDGTQPAQLSMATFRTISLPICWKAQRKLLGFAA